MTLYLLLAIALFTLALHTLVAQSHLLRKIMALNMMGSAAFLWLAAIAARGPETPPDPVPHAMILTGIVVSVSATAFALALVRHLHGSTGAPHLVEDEDAYEDE